MVQKDLSSKPIEGRHKTLQCQVVSEGKPAATQYRWYRNNMDVTETEGKYERLNTNELVIRNLNTADDGSYGCRIQNDAGLGIQKGTYKLEVLCKAIFIFTIFQGYHFSYYLSCFPLMSKKSGVFDFTIRMIKKVIHFNRESPSFYRYFINISIKFFNKSSNSFVLLINYL